MEHQPEQTEKEQKPQAGEEDMEVERPDLEKAESKSEKPVSLQAALKRMIDDATPAPPAHPEPEEEEQDLDKLAESAKGMCIEW